MPYIWFLHPFFSFFSSLYLRSVSCCSACEANEGCNPYILDGSGLHTLLVFPNRIHKVSSGALCFPLYSPHSLSKPSMSRCLFGVPGTCPQPLPPWVSDTGWTDMRSKFVGAQGPLHPLSITRIEGRIPLEQEQLFIANQHQKHSACSFAIQGKVPWQPLRLPPKHSESGAAACSTMDLSQDSLPSMFQLQEQRLASISLRDGALWHRATAQSVCPLQDVQTTCQYHLHGRFCSLCPTCPPLPTVLSSLSCRECPVALSLTPSAMLQLCYQDSIVCCCPD